jgi:hypothetical protein
MQMRGMQNVCQKITIIQNAQHTKNELGSPKYI